MNVITSATLRQIQLDCPDAADALEDWQTIVRRTTFGNFAEIRDTFATVSWVGPDYVIFNTRGGHYRLITRVNFPYQSFFLKHFLTHAEYDDWRP
ncbi:Type II toxin-antitoxin system HigB family toxin [Deinococcus saxicola]|uniref:type II toxin-antitoxin system HigB family toxin n=1 Tax=Deinococcus saxicola TaxID=249406 RepID=UPI0039F11B81